MIINVLNGVIQHFYIQLKNKNRLSNYIKHEKDVDYTGINFPVSLNQIEKNRKFK